MTEQAVATTIPSSGFFETLRALGAFFRRNLTPKTTIAVAAWRLEGWFAGPLALLLVATLGRWTGALAMGAIMACFSAAFLYWTASVCWTRCEAGWASAAGAAGRREFATVKTLQASLRKCW